MKNNEATIFVFIASVIVGLLIAMNIGFEGKSNLLDAGQYDVAYNERSKLYSDLNNLNDEYDKINQKLNKYESGYAETDQVKKQMEEEVNNNNIILGSTDVEGPGIKITLDDADEVGSTFQLIHDVDILGVLNDLRNAGAEAISVNGERVVASNYGYCGGPYINLNGIKIVSPFYIKAIGNQDTLYNYLTLENTRITSLKGREVKVNVTKVGKIRILSYTGTLGYKYMSLIKK
ncbi:MAG: DUF881 domain-containing protein [Clostridium sp.]|uniref:DUF881 domain-containing protein n=1 Tax=Clostridium sp. TaxID=1506 RepID=UPI003D6CC779